MLNKSAKRRIANMKDKLTRGDIEKFKREKELKETSKKQKKISKKLIDFQNK